MTLRDDARRIFGDAVSASDPARAVARVLAPSGTGFSISGHTFDVPGRLVLLSVGKASVPMARAAREILGPLVRGGLIVTKTSHSLGWVPVLSFDLVEAEHPVPGEGGIKAALLCEDILATLESEDVLLLLISGGASSLLADPIAPLLIEDLRETTTLLLRAGAAIGEVNCVRKHLSRLKGGNLALRAAPATVVVLALSDVLGDSLSVIGSGPACPDPSTFQDALEVVTRRGILMSLPKRVRELLERGDRGEIAETPKPGNPVFDRVFHAVIGSNRQAAEAAAVSARAHGYHPFVLTTTLEGEASERGAECARLARQTLSGTGPVPPPACLILGGEPTVTVKGNGKGGRCQELALAAAIGIEGLSGVVVLAAGTDGTDGPTEAAGAVVDGETLRRGREAGAEGSRSLEENDSHEFHLKAGSLLVTGPTGTNVNDLVLIVVGEPVAGPG